MKKAGDVRIIQGQFTKFEEICILKDFKEWQAICPGRERIRRNENGPLDHSPRFCEDVDALVAARIRPFAATAIIAGLSAKVEALSGPE